MLRRNWRAEHGLDGKDDALMGLKRIARRALHAKDVQQLLGLEGEAAAIYFGKFENMLATNATDGLGTFSFTTRNRRPPTDPVNAILSLAYALLVRVFSHTISSTGLDPYLGLYHRPRHNRPALALDLMEPFRSIIADSCVIQVVNNGEVRPNHFVFNGPACSLKPQGRKALIAAFERRLEQVTTHPLFGYRVSMRRRIARGRNPGRKSCKFIRGCTICVSCHSTGPCWTVPRKRENRSGLAGIATLFGGHPLGLVQ